MAWANHLPNLLLIDRFVGSSEDNSLQRIATHLKAIHRQYFEQMQMPPTSPLLSPCALPPVAATAAASGRRAPPLATVPESAPLASGVASGTRSPLMPRDVSARGEVRTAPPSPLIRPAEAPSAAAASSALAEDDEIDSVAGLEECGGITPDMASGLLPLGDLTPFPRAADVRELLLERCEKILEGVDCTFAGPSSLLVVDGLVPPEVQLARRFGATIRSEVRSLASPRRAVGSIPHVAIVPCAVPTCRPPLPLLTSSPRRVPSQVGPACTHLIVPPALLTEGTLACGRTDSLLRQWREHRCELHVVDARWLLDCVSRWQRLPEEEYTLPLECLTLPCLQVRMPHPPARA